MVVFRYKEWGLMIYIVDRVQQCLACRPGTSVCWAGEHHRLPPGSDAREMLVWNRTPQPATVHQIQFIFHLGVSSSG